MRDRERPVVFLLLDSAGLWAWNACLNTEILHGSALVSEDCADMPDPVEEEKHLPMD